MRYLPAVSVSLLLMIAVAGCHRRQSRVEPPSQAEAPPIVSTLPPMPLLTLPDVELAKTKPPAPAPPPATPPKQPPKKVARKHMHRVRKPEEEKPEPSAETSSSAGTPADTSQSSASTSVKTPILGQLSTDDTAADPDAKKDTRGLIQDTENRLKTLSNSLREAHKNDIAQIESFLKQAEQAWSTNDVVGAQTLANKAKILLDDLSK